MTFSSSHVRSAFVLSFGLLGAVLSVAAANAQDANEAGTRQYAAAVALHNKQLYELAEDEWRKFVTDFPKHPRAAYGYHYLGVCQFKQGKFAEAAPSFAKVVQDFPKFDQLEASYLYLGLTQFSLGRKGQAGDFAKAAETFADLLKKFPEGKYLPQAMYYRGECFYAQNEREKAIDNYAGLLRRFPDDPLAADALYAMGVSQEELKQWEAAGNSYGAFLKRFPKNPLVTEVGMRLGETLFAREQFPQAEAWFAHVASVKGFAQADHATLRQAACLSAAQEICRRRGAVSIVPAEVPKGGCEGPVASPDGRR